MCGIVGIWEYAASVGSVEIPLIERMRDEMTHRGPDAAGTQLFDGGRGGFGFRRLSIVDLSDAGNQPMTGCPDRDILLVFNGEIYNHRDLRSGLEKRGHAYHSQTDSETIIHQYEEDGVEMVRKIEGDFGIAIWDGERQELSLYRDRLGVKPLYYMMVGGRIIFASEIKAILKHPDVTAEMNDGVLGDYLTFLTTPAPHTLFKNIYKLPAGCRLIIDRAGKHVVERYWDAIPVSNYEKKTEAEHCDDIHRLLRASIEKRMMSDVPFGVFLSGGVDSTANVALMSEITDRVRTYTVGFEGHDYLNELKQAHRIAKLHNTDHHEVVIGDKELEDFLPDLIFHQDEPIADPVCIPLYYVSKLARDSGTIVVQVGEGADEIFCGYDKYVNYLRIYEKVWSHGSRAPTSLRKLAGGAAGTVLAATGSGRTSVEIARRFAAGEPLFWGAATVFDEELKRQVIDARSSLEAVQEHIDEFRRSGNGDFLSQMTYLELKLRLPELLLMRVDKVTMATSVEARVPFLDHHLVEYAMGLPRSVKVKGRMGKYILKKALEGIVPDDVLYAKKRGFGAPIREWFRTSGGVSHARRMLDSPLVTDGTLNGAVIAKLLDEHISGRRDWSFHLWALLNLTLWHERWIERNG